MNYSSEPDETIALAGKLIEKTNQNDIKYDAFRFLAYAYKAKGDLNSAKAAVEQIPELYFTKLTEMAFLLSGKDKFEAAQKQKWISFENLMQMMWRVAEYYEEEGKYAEAMEEVQKALQLLPIFQNEKFQVYTEFFEKQTKRLSEKML